MTASFVTPFVATLYECVVKEPLEVFIYIQKLHSEAYISSGGLDCGEAPSKVYIPGSVEAHSEATVCK